MIKEKHFLRRGLSTDGRVGQEGSPPGSGAHCIFHGEMQAVHLGRESQSRTLDPSLGNVYQELFRTFQSWWRLRRSLQVDVTKIKRNCLDSMSTKLWQKMTLAKMVKINIFTTLKVNQELVTIQGSFTPDN